MGSREIPYYDDDDPTVNHDDGQVCSDCPGQRSETCCITQHAMDEDANRVEERFFPELGQAAFSNTQWQQYECSELAVAALWAIGDEIGRVVGNATQEPTYPPTASYGGEQFVTDVFAMRPYCWCEGDQHPAGCPPNFEWKNVRVCWYKHVGRSPSCNVVLAPDMIAEMLTECLTAIRQAEPDWY